MPPQNYDSDDLADYDGDDYDNEEDELSPEDKVAMSNGVAEVRKVLGSDANKLTATQIQDALWHYYYDVDKSVAYLRKTYIPAQPKPAPKKAPEGEFGNVFLSATHELCTSNAGAGHEHSTYHTTQSLISNIPSLTPTYPPAYPVVNKPCLPTALDFSDMPWLNVPRHRLTTFIEPPRPRGGLLGGGEGPPKMSKLQALAAERKKKNELKKEQDKAAQAEAGIQKLSISEQTLKENRPPTFSAKRQKLSDQPTVSPESSVQDPHALTQSSNLPPSGQQAAQESLPEAPAVTSETQDDSGSRVILEKANPSAFARTLFGPAPGQASSHKKDVFSMPYTSSSAFLATAFTEPSPDDVVLAAQAKGSNFTRTK